MNPIETAASEAQMQRTRLPNLFAIKSSKARSRRATVRTIAQVANSTLAKPMMLTQANAPFSTIATTLSAQSGPSYRPIFMYVLNRRFALQL